MDRQLQNELDADETLLWASQPSPNDFAWRGGGGALFLFGILWTTFVVYWMVGAGFTALLSRIISGARLHTEDLFPLFGIPFVLIGVCMLLSPLLLRSMAARSVYAVTEKRVLILQGGWRKSISVQSVWPEHMRNRKRTQKSDGSGDLIFRDLTLRRASDEDAAQKEVRMYGVGDIKALDDLIRRTFEN